MYTSVNPCELGKCESDREINLLSTGSPKQILQL